MATLFLSSGRHECALHGNLIVRAQMGWGRDINDFITTTQVNVNIYNENNYNPSTNPFLFHVELSLFSTRAFSKIHFFVFYLFIYFSKERKRETSCKKYQNKEELYRTYWLFSFDSYN